MYITQTKLSEPNIPLKTFGATSIHIYMPRRVKAKKKHADILAFCPQPNKSVKRKRSAIESESDDVGKPARKRMRRTTKKEQKGDTSMESAESPKTKRAKKVITRTASKRRLSLTLSSSSEEVLLCLVC